MRVSLSLALLLALTATALADIPPPPPKPGKKFVPVVRTVEITREIPGYAFYHVWWDHGPRDSRGRPLEPPTGPDGKRPEPFKPVRHTSRYTLKPGNPAPFPVTFYVVPAKALADYPDPDALGEAIEKKKIPGTFTLPWAGDGEIATSDPRKEVKLRYVLDGVDPEKGIDYQIITDDPQPEAFGPPLASQPGSILWPLWLAMGVTGVTALFLGLWIYRSRNGKAA